MESDLSNPGRVVVCLQECTTQTKFELSKVRLALQIFKHIHNLVQNIQMYGHWKSANQGFYICVCTVAGFSNDNREQ